MYHIMRLCKKTTTLQGAKKSYMTSLSLIHVSLFSHVFLINFTKNVFLNVTLDILTV